MALQMLYQLNGADGIDIPTAYVRIENLSIKHNPTQAAALVLAGKGTGTKYVCSIMLVVKAAKPKTTLDTWSKDAWKFAYDHTINANPIQQAYAFLKTLPEFSAATDVTD